MRVGRYLSSYILHLPKVHGKADRSLKDMIARSQILSVERQWQHSDGYSLVTRLWPGSAVKCLCLCLISLYRHSWTRVMEGLQTSNDRDFSWYLSREESTLIPCTHISRLTGKFIPRPLSSGGVSCIWFPNCNLSNTVWLRLNVHQHRHMGQRDFSLIVKHCYFRSKYGQAWP